MWGLSYWKGTSRSSRYTMGVNVPATAFIACREYTINRIRRKLSWPTTGSDGIQFQAWDRGMQLLLRNMQLIPLLQLLLRVSPNLPKLLIFHLQLYNLSLILFLLSNNNFVCYGAAMINTLTHRNSSSRSDNDINWCCQILRHADTSVSFVKLRQFKMTGSCGLDTASSSFICAVTSLLRFPSSIWLCNEQQN